MSSKAAAARPARGAGVQTVYEQLQSAIVNLELPPGSPLDEVRLSRQFALSRTPVREALVRLMADGLVTALPNRSTVVAPIDFEKLPVYFEALTLMYRVTTRA
ncbi:MAG: GntR family transcriptional regulator, partial [Devosia sp.]